MVARVVLGGQPLERYGAVADLTDSTRFTTKLFDNDPSGWSGDYQSACTFAAGPNFSAPWFRLNATYEVIEHGHRTWGGIVTNLTPGADGWSITATGYGYPLSLWRAFEANLSAPGGTLQVKSSAIADAALDYATGRGLPIDRHGNTIGATAVADPDGFSRTLAHLLDLTGKAAGKRYWIDSWGEIALVDDPARPVWQTAPGTAYVGTADDEFYSHMYGRFVNGLDANGEPNDWQYVGAGDDEMAIQNGRREVEVDLTPLGLLPPSAAQSNVDGRFKLVGARMSFTDPVQLTPANLARVGGGPADPLAMWGRNGAGTARRLHGTADTRSTPTTRAAVQFTIGELTRNHQTRTAVAKPLGFVARDFAGAIAAAQRPSDQTAAA